MKSILWLVFSLLAVGNSWSQCVSFPEFQRQVPNWGQGLSVLDLVSWTDQFVVEVAIDVDAGGSLRDGSGNAAAPSYLLDCGSPLTLTAVPDPCYRFVGWEGDLNTTMNPLVIPAIGGPLHVVARFASNQANITVSANHGGSTDMDGYHPNFCGQMKIWANASPVSQFVGWSGAASGSANPLQLDSIQGNLQITAEYALKPGVEESGPNMAGQVVGMVNPTSARVVLEGNNDVRTAIPGGDGSFAFNGVPDGIYYLKVEAEGHYSDHKRLLVSAGNPNRTGLNIAMTALTTNPFRYHWEGDGSTSGTRATAAVATPPVIVFLGDPLPAPSQDFAQKLYFDYHIILSDEEEPWTGELAYRLLEVMKTIPQEIRYPYSAQTLKPSKWILTASLLGDDIEITREDSGDTVRITDRAFVNAAPRMVELDGVRGRYFSRRLHHALVRFVTEDGEDAVAVEKILQERFDVSINVPDYAALTADTTGESASRFQAFHPRELVEIINMFEEMPLGLQVTPGLHYLVRRANGQPHPINPGAAAVAWPYNGYIEFMEVAFLTDLADTHRLILHEKAHFLWANLFSDEIKNEWIDIGGWYEDPGDPDGWSTTLQTEFVSAYAHHHNPDEDMAESIAHYVLYPNKLRSRAPEKYEFMRDRIMHGSRYITLVDPQFAFEVLNLQPDYDYPGKIKRVDVTVEGLPEEDKLITVELELEVGERLFAGASMAYMRIFNEGGTYIDMYLNPANASGSILRGVRPVSKYAKSGFWRPDQIVVSDLVGNQRFEGTNDFGWRMYINNPLEDLEGPTYVRGSLAIGTYPETHSSGHVYTMMDITWLIQDNRPLDYASSYATVVNRSAVQYSVGSWGSVDAQTGMARVQIPITEYMRSGTYTVPYVSMIDAAYNWGAQFFSDSPPDEPLVTVQIVTTNADEQPPDLDLDSIQITAAPTNPQAPNGETVVNIVYYARDDKSGVGNVSYRLLDPQGISHFAYHYHPNFYTLFFEGDPTQWQRFEINVVLPVGSAPGIWALEALSLRDKVNNINDQIFVETVLFEVGNATPLTTTEYYRQPKPATPPAGVIDLP